MDSTSNAASSKRQTHSNRTSNRKHSLLSASAGGASLLIGLQVGSRALTFILNQVLLRYLSPELLGISTQLEVYSISVLFFARESLRVAIQRQADIVDSVPEADDETQVPEGHVDGKTSAGRTQTIVNLSYISICLGAIFAIVLRLAYTVTLRSGDPRILATPYFLLSLKIYGWAAFCELLSEPGFVVVQQKSRFKIRAAAESVATVLRCIVTCGSAIWAARTGKELGVLPFALGQVIYSVGLLLVYSCSVWSISAEGGFSLILKPIYSNANNYIVSYFYNPLLTLGGSLFAQSLVKHVLTQGDTILIASLASTESQGIYALANNYGGLVARLVLQPIEESSRNYFGKLLSSDNGKPSGKLILAARESLITLLRAYVLLSVCVVAVGPTIAPLLLNIVAGSTWKFSSAGHVLATYCYYIPLLAINGLTEAFVSSVATKSDVNRQSVWMLAFSVGFGGAAFIFLRVLQWGAEGLVWANTLNMAFRISWSSAFIASYLRQHGTQLKIRSLMPYPLTVSAGVGTYAIMTQVEKGFTGGLSDFVKTGTVAALFAIAIAISERVYLLQSYRSLQG